MEGRVCLHSQIENSTSGVSIRTDLFYFHVSSLLELFKKIVVKHIQHKIYPLSFEAHSSGA